MKTSIQSISRYAYSAARHLRTILEVKKQIRVQKSNRNGYLTICYVLMNINLFFMCAIWEYLTFMLIMVALCNRADHNIFIL